MPSGITTPSGPQNEINQASLLPGVNVLIEGPGGTGKTFSLGTLVDTGIETFYLGLDSGVESLFAYWTDRGKPIPPNFHWHMISNVSGGFASFKEQADQVAMMAQDALYKIQDFTRSVNNPFTKVLAQLINFEDQRTGQTFGSAEKWGPDKAIVIDGLTGLGKFAMRMVIGKKPVRSQTDWGIAQGHVDHMLDLLCNDCKCHFVLLSHVERETDPVVGGTKITVSTLGRALAPVIPSKFSDVILASRDGAKWAWNTANSLADLKTRNLPVQDGLPPSFGPIIEKWKSRGGRISPVVKA